VKRLLISSALALPLLALTAGPAMADVKTREKARVTIGGALGKIVNLFGGKAAKEGVVSTVAVKGNRKASMNESTGTIIDLSEEKVYELDMKAKTFEVTTFAELRRRMQEAREKAEKQAAEQEKDEKGEKPAQPQKEYEVDFDVKETGQKKQLAGYDTREVVTTIVVREKGTTLEEAGGIVMTTVSWLAPQIAAMKEITDFDQRYWKALQGPDAMGMSAAQLAMVLAAFPAVSKATERMAKEGPQLRGTPIVTTMTVESVKSKAQMTEQPAENKSSGGGIGGMLARKMAKKDSTASPRAMIFTTELEYQEIQASVAPADIDLPAGFKEKK
jgi:hypothetical protein